MIESQISPIFGLGLLELVELITLLVMTVPAAASLVIAWVIWLTNNKNIKQQQKQLEQQQKSLDQQKKIDSARLAWELYYDWRVSGQFSDEMLPSLVNGTLKEVDDIDLILERFANIASFWKEGTLTKYHMMEFFSPNLEQMVTNDAVLNRLRELRKKDNEMYSTLWSLLHQIGLRIGVQIE